MYRELARIALAACLVSWPDFVLATPAPANFAQAATQIVQNYADRHQFSGYVLIAHEGRTIWSRGFGLADRELNQASTSGTRFRIGSLTKQFTAAAVLLLVEDGKVGLDDPVSKYYTAAPAAWEGMTVRHLLEHRSGLFNITLAPQFGALLRETPTVAALMQVIRDLPLEFEPGTKFAYGNSASVVAGYIVERASGMNYREFIEKRVLAPLNMTRSGYEFMDPLLQERAVGYELREGAWQRARLFPTDLMYAAGALYSTAEDLLRWDQALESDALLNEASRAALLGDPQGDGYGFGLFIEQFGGRASHYAGGGQPGFLTFLRRFPQERVIFIVLANTQSAPIQNIGDDLARLYFNLPTPVAPTPVTISETVLEHYVGEYELYPGVRLIFTRQDGELFMRRVGGLPPPPPHPEKLIAIATDTFIGADCRIVFATEGAARAPWLSYTIPRLKTERPAPRINE